MAGIKSIGGVSIGGATVSATTPLTWFYPSFTPDISKFLERIPQSRFDFPTGIQYDINTNFVAALSTESKLPKPAKKLPETVHLQTLIPLDVDTAFVANLTFSPKPPVLKKPAPYTSYSYTIGFDSPPPFDVTTISGFITSSYALKRRPPPPETVISQTLTPLDADTAFVSGLTSSKIPQPPKKPYPSTFTAQADIFYTPAMDGMLTFSSLPKPKVRVTTSPFNYQNPPLDVDTNFVSGLTESKLLHLKPVVYPRNNLDWVYKPNFIYNDSFTETIVLTDIISGGLDLSYAFTETIFLTDSVIGNKNGARVYFVGYYTPIAPEPAITLTAYYSLPQMIILDGYYIPEPTQVLVAYYNQPEPMIYFVGYYRG